MDDRMVDHEATPSLSLMPRTVEFGLRHKVRLCVICYMMYGKGRHTHAIILHSWATEANDLQSFT